MNKINYIIFNGIISLLILAMINVSLDLSLYSFRSISAEKETVVEIDVNSVAELVLEVGFDLEDQEINEEEEVPPAKPQKPVLKLVPGKWFLQLIIPNRFIEIKFISISLNHYSSIFSQDSPPPRV
ncbi:MAG: hypothetical protein N2167_01910 [Flavobacteriales bacterium]|nr:hypothetical protein [Flavobacteriales bacterium]